MALLNALEWLPGGASTSLWLILRALSAMAMTAVNLLPTFFSISSRGNLLMQTPHARNRQDTAGVDP